MLLQRRKKNSFPFDCTSVNCCTLFVIRSVGITGAIGNAIFFLWFYGVHNNFLSSVINMTSWNSTVTYMITCVIVVFFLCKSKSQLFIPQNFKLARRSFTAVVYVIFYSCVTCRMKNAVVKYRNKYSFCEINFFDFWKQYFILVIYEKYILFFCNKWRLECVSNQIIRLTLVLCFWLLLNFLGKTQSIHILLLNNSLILFKCKHIFFYSILISIISNNFSKKSLSKDSTTLYHVLKNLNDVRWSGVTSQSNDIMR